MLSKSINYVVSSGSEYSTKFSFKTDTVNEGWRLMNFELIKLIGCRFWKLRHGLCIPLL